MDLFGLQYNPQNVKPVLIIVVIIFAIAIFVAWGFWKMANLRKTGELLTSWDVGNSSSEIEVTVPRDNEVLLVFLDYKYKGLAPRNAEHFIILENKSDGTKYDVDVARRGDYLIQVSPYTVFSFGTKGTILGQVKDVKTGTYSVRFKESDNLDDVTKVDFVLRETGW